MKNLILAVAVVLVLSSTACAGWYVGPTAGYAYYPMGPVYAYPAPYVAYSPVVAVRPAWVGRPVVVGPVGRAYIPGRPVRNTVRAVLR